MFRLKHLTHMTECGQQNIDVRNVGINKECNFYDASLGRQCRVQYCCNILPVCIHFIYKLKSKISWTAQGSLV
jgi:hypothetical protein